MLQLNRNLGQVEQVEHPSAATGLSPVLHFAINFLRRQYVVVAVAVALTTLLGVVYLNTTPPTFTASARMLIDTRKQEVLFQQQLMGRDLIDTAMVESQVEVLKSQTIAQAVVKDQPPYRKSGFCRSREQPVGDRDCRDFWCATA